MLTNDQLEAQAARLSKEIHDTAQRWMNEPTAIPPEVQVAVRRGDYATGFYEAAAQHLAPAWVVLIDRHLGQPENERLVIMTQYDPNPQD